VSGYAVRETTQILLPFGTLDSRDHRSALASLCSSGGRDLEIFVFRVPRQRHPSIFRAGENSPEVRVTITRRNGEKLNINMLPVDSGIVRGDYFQISQLTIC
jgi:hypothetical protein